MNIQELYNTNEDVKTYIDKFATSNNMSIHQAFEIKMVRNYIQWMKEQKKI